MTDLPESRCFASVRNASQNYERLHRRCEYPRILIHLHRPFINTLGVGLIIGIQQLMPKKESGTTNENANLVGTYWAGREINTRLDGQGSRAGGLLYISTNPVLAVLFNMQRWVAARYDQLDGVVRTVAVTSWSEAINKRRRSPMCLGGVSHLCQGEDAPDTVRSSLCAPYSNCFGEMVTRGSVTVIPWKVDYFHHPWHLPRVLKTARY